MYKSKDKIVFEYRDLQKCLVDLEGIIKDKNIKNLVSIYRGSIPIGVKLSNKYNLPLSIVDFQTRDGNSKQPSMIKNILQEGNVLILDDILDTGLTMNKVEEFIKGKTDLKDKIYCYAFCKNKELISKNNWIYSLDTNKDEWIIFEPWE